MATQNAKRETRESQFASPSVARFQTEQSLPARVQRERTRQNAANDDTSETIREAVNENYRQDETAHPARGGNRVGGVVARKANPLMHALVGLEYGVAGTVAYLQFWLGLTALVFVAFGFYDVFFGVTGDQVAEFAGSTIGSFALAGANLVGSVFGFHLEIPTVSLSAIGLACWGLAFIFTLLGYGAVALMLRLEGVDVFGSIELTLLTLSMLALDLIFVTQLFPWMMVWIFLVHIDRVAKAF